MALWKGITFMQNDIAAADYLTCPANPCCNTPWQQLNVTTHLLQSSWPSGATAQCLASEGSG